MNAANQAKQALEAKLSAVAGRPVEITIRGERAFTFWFDGIDAAAAQRLAATTDGEKVTIESDADLGTCVYIN
jgi:hypothetical protein